MTTAIYVRISSDATGDRAGVQRQRADCEALCKRRKWKFTTFEDNDVSAFSGRRRPAYEAMLRAIASGSITRVVAWHPDRLHRQPRELESFIDTVERHDVAVVTVTAGDLDLSTPEGRLTARIVGAVARKESEDKSRRIARKHLELATTGQWRGGSRVFGYTNEMQIDPTEAKAIRQAVRDVLAGSASCGTIARRWNESGFRTARGNTWQRVTVRQFLGGSAIAGIRTHKGEVVAQGQWKPIISEDQHRRLVNLFAGKTRTTNNGVTARKHALAGFVVCARCGTPLVYAKNNGSKALACRHPEKGCNGISIKAAPVEAIVYDAITAMLATDRERLAKVAANADSNPKVYDEIAELRQRLTDVEDAHFVDGTITKARFTQMRARIVDRIAGLEAQMPSPAANIDLTKKFGDVRNLPLDQLSALVRLYLSAVGARAFEIRPASKRGAPFDPSRIALV